MKQFIVLAAVFPLIVVFVMQFSLEQQNQNRISQLQELVYSAKEQAKQEGRFSQAIKSELAGEIASCFGIDASEVIIEADERVHYRKNEMDARELISYKVKAPIEKIMAGNRFMGISDAENKGWYVVEGHTASEKLPE
ncbi:MAG: hypothetical protein LBT34_03145 [Clostridiales Family XIII bacterium]|nr:hypothetical protein [Clostridiales Family XIII bacterium]